MSHTLRHAASLTLLLGLVACAFLPQTHQDNWYYYQNPGARAAPPTVCPGLGSPALLYRNC